MSDTGDRRTRIPAPVEFDPRGEIWVDLDDRELPITLETERGDGYKCFDHMTVAQARGMRAALDRAIEMVVDARLAELQEEVDRAR